MRLVIFTDLDGSLLDHDDYSYEFAKPALGRINAQGIPLVIVTSKTRVEVEPLYRAIGFPAPFVVENGGGIFFPAGGPRPKSNPAGELPYDVICLGVPYREIRRYLAEIALGFSLRGFGDMTAAEIASLTGLSETEAQQAQAREFTEPFLVKHDSDLSEIERMAESRELAVTRGGRFYHLVKAGQSKGNAVKIVADFYRKEMNTTDLLTVGIGDSENDLSMLAQVDVPVLIPRPRRGFLAIDLPGLLHAPEPGARGWNSVVEAILDRMA